MRQRPEELPGDPLGPLPLRTLPAALQEVAVAFAAEAGLPAEQVLAGTWGDFRALMERLANEKAVQAAIAQVQHQNRVTDRAAHPRAARTSPIGDL